MLQSLCMHKLEYSSHNQDHLQTITRLALKHVYYNTLIYSTLQSNYYIAMCIITITMHLGVALLERLIHILPF